MNNLPILKDKKGNVIREFDIIKIFHFIGARSKKYYMYKIAGTKDHKLGKQWFFYHSPKELFNHNQELGKGGYYPNFTTKSEEFILTQAEVIDSTLTLEEEFQELTKK